MRILMLMLLSIVLTSCGINKTTVAPRKCVVTSKLLEQAALKKPDLKDMDDVVSSYEDLLKANRGLNQRLYELRITLKECESVEIR